MTDGDKERFIKILRLSMLANHGSVVEPDMLNFWWHKLKCYPIDKVAAAFDRYTSESERPPTPAGILKLLTEMNPSLEEPFRALPRPPQDKELAKQELAKLRAMIDKMTMKTTQTGSTE